MTADDETTGGAGHGNGGGLPVTGVALTGITLTGAAMVAGGAVLLALLRRRNETAMAAADHTVPESPPEA